MEEIQRERERDWEKNDDKTTETCCLLVYPLVRPFTSLSLFSLLLLMSLTFPSPSDDVVVSCLCVSLRLSKALKKNRFLFLNLLLLLLRFKVAKRVQRARQRVVASPVFT